MLREVPHLHAASDGDLAGVGLGLSGDELEERRLSRAVDAHDAPSLAAADEQVEPVVDLALAVALDHPVDLRDVLARARRGAEVELEHLAPLGRLDALDLVELFHPRLHLRRVARARLELGDEGFLLREHRLLARVLRFLLRRRDRALLLVKFVVAGVRRELAAVDLDDLRDEAVQKLAIVGRHHERAFELAKEPLEPDDRLDVEVVGRLVEEERVGLHEQDARERDAHLPAAGELADVALDHLVAKAEPRQDLARPRLEGVSAELVEAGLRVAEALDELVEIARLLGIGHRVLERVELVRRLGDLAGAGHRLFDDGAPAHLADVLAEVADRHPALDGDLPPSGGSSPVIIRKMVDLPEPFGPTSPTFSPR